MDNLQRKIAQYATPDSDNVDAQTPPNIVYGRARINKNSQSSIFYLITNM